MPTKAKNPACFRCGGRTTKHNRTFRCRQEFGACGLWIRGDHGGISNGRKSSTWRFFAKSYTEANGEACAEAKNEALANLPWLTVVETCTPGESDLVELNRRLEGLLRELSH